LDVSFLIKAVAKPPLSFNIRQLHLTLIIQDADAGSGGVCRHPISKFVQHDHQPFYLRSLGKRMEQDQTAGF